MFGFIPERAIKAWSNAIARFNVPALALKGGSNRLALGPTYLSR
jgi:hypothetical protein